MATCSLSASNSRLNAIPADLSRAPPPFHASRILSISSGEAFIDEGIPARAGCKGGGSCSLHPRLRLFSRLIHHACSTTARRGALDWAPIFEAANKPVFEKLYKSVRDGTETRRSLEFNSQPNYREAFAKETAEIDNQEIWRAGKTVRSLRPDAKNN